MAKDDFPYEIEAFILRKTADGVLIRQEDSEEEVWLPLSQVELDDEDASFTTVTMPEWLAIERGLA